MIKDVNSFMWYYFNTHRVVPTGIRKDFDRLIAAAHHLDKHPSRIDVHSRIVSIMSSILRQDNSAQVAATMMEFADKISVKNYPKRYRDKFIERANIRFAKLIEILADCCDRVSMEYDDTIMEIAGLAEEVRFAIATNPTKAMMNLAKDYYIIQWRILSTMKALIAIAEGRNDSTSVGVLQEAYNNMSKVVSHWK